VWLFLYPRLGAREGAEQGKLTDDEERAKHDRIES
jgi:hypothetical protein